MTGKLPYFGRTPTDPQWPQASRTIPPPCWATELFGNERSCWPSLASSVAADPGVPEHGPAAVPGGIAELSPVILEHVSSLQW